MPLAIIRLLLLCIIRSSPKTTFTFVWNTAAVENSSEVSDGKGPEDTLLMAPKHYKPDLGNVFRKTMLGSTPAKSLLPWSIFI